MNFRTQYSAMREPLEIRSCRWYSCNEPSKTVPDMTMSLRTLVQRFIQKRDVPQGDGIYLEENSFLHDFPVEFMDAEERIELAQAIDYTVQEEAAKLRKPKKQPPAAPNPEIIRDDITGI